MDGNNGGYYRSKAIIGRKTWHAAPKVEGANRTEKFRDIDAGNTCRRVIATMFSTVMQEVCQREIHVAQQAFLPSRNIMRNTTLLLRTFGDARTSNEERGRVGGERANFDSDKELGEELRRNFAVADVAVGLLERL